MSVIPREILVYFLSDYAAPGEHFPTGERMQEVGKAHRIADTYDCGWDYSYGEVLYAIQWWVSCGDARHYMNGYKREPVEPAEWRYRLSQMHSRA